MPRKNATQAGFTLVELMISLFIFGMLSAAGVGLLSYSTQAQAVTAQRLEGVAAERRLTAILTNDLAQAVARISRDLTGAPEPAFRGGQGPVLLRYVHAGRANSGDAARSGIQRVEWRLNQARLERITRPLVDGASDAEPTIMAENVERVALRFRNEGVWLADWAPSDPLELPEAVELTITRKGVAPLTRLFLAGAGY
ncbi:MAG: type II secretion system minor pseudopilin GspJ [Pseudomonadota bacterium]